MFALTFKESDVCANRVGGADFPNKWNLDSNLLLSFGFSIPNKSYSTSFGVFIFGLTIFENRVMEEAEEEKERENDY